PPPNSSGSHPSPTSTTSVGPRGMKFLISIGNAHPSLLQFTARCPQLWPKNFNSRMSINLFNRCLSPSESLQIEMNKRVLRLYSIRELNKSLSEKIDLSSAQLQTSINGVKATLDKVLTRVAEAENRISQTEDAISELKQLTKQLKGDNEFLKKKIDQLENYSSRNNIRVLGLKEGSEVMDPVKFFTTWIPELLGAGGPDAAAQRLEVKIERAHRTGTMEPRPGEPPPFKFINSLAQQMSTTMAGLSLRDRVRSSAIQEGLRVEPLLLHVEEARASGKDASWTPPW
uniref:L1 transposable element RRM domain-containing protein n=1 Tax=Poecilia mexicana TaxID=48701 RepID=A0A3B3XPM7_9TELE